LDVRLLEGVDVYLCRENVGAEGESERIGKRKSRGSVVGWGKWCREERKRRHKRRR